MSMDNLQAAGPAAPVAAIKSAAPDAPADSEAPPWIAAFQAALAHVKNLHPATPRAAATGDAADDAATATPGTDDPLRAATDPALTAPPGAPVPLVATLLPGVAPVPPAAAAAPADASRAPAGGAAETLLTAAGADNGARTAAPPRNAGHDVAKAAPGGPDAVAGSDAVLRAIERASAREGATHDANAAPQIQFTPAHAAPAPAAPAATPPAQLQINTAVGAAGWGPELGQKMTWMIGEKSHTAELHLNPPDLGPLDIKLTIGEHETTAVFTSPHGAVREAVESALPRLREVLAESGITLGNTSVTADGPHDGSAFAASQEQARHGAAGQSAPAALGIDAQQATVMAVRHNGMVDLFA